MCTDENIKLQGDYNSDKASLFKITMQRCDPQARRPEEKLCKPEDEITEWIKRKFIVVLTNQQRFDIEEIGSEATIISESRLTWFPIASQSREEAVNNVEMTEIELQLGSMSEQQVVEMVVNSSINESK